MPPRGYKRRAGRQLGRRAKRHRGRMSVFGRPYYTTRKAYRRGRKSYRSRRSRKFPRRYRRRRSYRGRKRSFASRVFKAISPIKDFVAEYGQEHSVSGTTTGGPACVYFTAESYNPASTVDSVADVYLFDWQHLMVIADYYRFSTLLDYYQPAAIAARQLTDLKFRYLIERAQCLYHIRNQSTEPVYVTAYYVKPRGNMQFTSASGATNVYTTLARGFANNGIDASHINASNNAAIVLARYTPFQSLDFVRSFKVYKVKKVRVNPGDISAFSLRGKRRFIRPYDYITGSGIAGGAPTQWQASTRKFDHFRTDRFVLFKVRANIAGYGAVQGTYSKLIQATTPSVIMDTFFRYTTRAVVDYNTTAAQINVAGFIDSAGAAHNPAIVVPDGDVVGEEKDAN